MTNFTPYALLWLGIVFILWGIVWGTIGLIYKKDDWRKK